MFNLTSRPENKPKESESIRDESNENQSKIPSISLPKGGGAIRGIGEKFAANPVTGTGSLSVPIYTSPGRSGFGPQLSLSYDSGSGNGPCGFGWSLSLPSITRKTDKGLPKYRDCLPKYQDSEVSESSEGSDVFILSGAEDLVPVLVFKNGEWKRDPLDSEDGTFKIQRYRPRIEGLFARIERWTDKKTGEIHWRSISKDNVTTIYGKTVESRISEPIDKPTDEPIDEQIDKSHTFSWLICESYDDKGNAIFYKYEAENSDNVDISQANEINRNQRTRSSNRYLKRIFYGNCIPRQPDEDLSKRKDWLFEVLFDYDEGHYEMLPEENGCQFVRATIDKQRKWSVRRDPFSSYRAGFEVRTYRLCHRVLMFHHFKDLPIDNCLIRSTEFSYNDSQSKGPNFSFITKITQSGYVFKSSDANLGDKYLKKSLPPIEFEYSQANIDEKIYDVDAKSLENMPYGLDGTHYQLVDLDGEGISSVLVEQEGAWFYKRNVSPISIQKDELGNPVKNEYGDLRSKAQFEPTEIIRSIPSLANLNSGKQQFLDLAGDGQLDLVEFNSPTPGFYERTEDKQWKQFTPFASFPNLDWNNPNLKFVDLTGDGHADIIITENEVFTWYESLGEAGFSPAEKVFQALNEEKGPRLIFSDSTQSIYLADMSGDGLTDLVRIQNGEVCYWPNLGYGRFSGKVIMDNSPWFDNPDQFNQQRIRLADIDGSGTTDIIYLKRDGVHIYYNQSGNRWTELEPRTPFPQIDNLIAVMTADLLGNGTACLVWSSPLPGYSSQQMRYLDLMCGQKPHLLVGMKNNLGAETRVHYAPSTKFYLEDLKKGKPWITCIPFPVHVVEHVETYDKISGNRFVTRYAYHHGYFDGVEREFRGFGMVEQWDTEEFSVLSTSDEFPAVTNIDQATHVPPVLTRTWFHTGAYFEGGNISRQLEKEYYGESDLSEGIPGLKKEQLDAMLLEDTILPDTVLIVDGTRVPFTLSVEEEREACRSLKGSILRQEIYALDGTDKEDRPYSVSERNYTIELLQMQGPNKYAVFFSHPRETIDFHYERELYEINGQKLADPRVTHSMTLEVDDFGNVLKSVAIGYERRHDEPDKLLTDDDKKKQKNTLVTYTENNYTNSIDQENAYRTPLPYETRTYELLRVSPESKEPLMTNLFRFGEILSKIKDASDGHHDIPYEDIDAAGAQENNPYRRLIEHVRTFYRKNDLTGRLAQKQLESLALPYESYKLAFTSGLVTKVYSNRVTDTILTNEGHYGHSEGDNNWWIPSGQAFYSPKEDNTPQEELAFARKHFFLPHRFCDPFGNNTFVYYDSNETDYSKNYDLLLKEMHDALGNTVTAENDYRVLQPKLMTDPNGNRSTAAFDALGMMVGTAVMGKVQEPDGKPKGDFLDGFKEDIALSEIQAFVANPRDKASDFLKGATSRIIYDIDRFLRCGQPPFAAILTREIHQNDPGGDESRIQISMVYSDGFGREIQTKIRAEFGHAPQRDPDELLRSNDVKPGKLVLENEKPKNGPTDYRWVGRGRTVYNNKGKPVKQYEPFFSNTHLFEEEPEMTDNGVTPVLFYDPLERVVATLHPNHTWEKVVFDPWRQEIWDVNDTIQFPYPIHEDVMLTDPSKDPDVGDFFKRLSASEYLPTWYESRKDLADGSKEKDAAIKAVKHASTPSVAHLDSLGRVFLTIADNGTYGKYPTRVEIDIEGNQRTVIDALNRVVMRYDYDMLGNKIHQASMEAGERWMLNDVTGKPIRAWDSRDHKFRTVYDQLRRPVESYMSKGAGQELLVSRTIYGETQPNPEPEAKNLRGKVYQVFDQAGVVTSDEYDFKGNLLSSHRKLAKNYINTLNWSPTALPVVLEDENFTSSTTYDALNRPIELIAPHSDKPGTKVNIIHPRYNEANLLESIEANLNGSTTATSFVTNIDYNAKGQRTKIVYGSGATAGRKGVITTYAYDPLTFRLVHLLTMRNADVYPDDCPQPPVNDWPGCQVQSQFYTYDPAGNIMYIRDDAQQRIYFREKRVEPSTEYTYDAIYRLIEAKGREHLGQIGGAPEPYSESDQPRVGIEWSANDGRAMGTYFESYVYDNVGNIKEMKHRGCDPAHPGWTRNYNYIEESQIEPATKKNNRLSSTMVSPNNPQVKRHVHDAHGNMIRMPHLANHADPEAPNMHWDYKDQLHQVDLAGSGTAYYVYDATGQRTRKVVEKSPGLIEERIYLGGFEVYREYNGNGALKLERETLHIMDDKQRIALVETRTQGEDNSLPELISYQLSNHLGSSSLELDGQARIISYEEYYPYGSTSYQAVHNQTETPKRYRYTGKERDEESGLYYHGARYYAPWLGRWTSCDPSELEDGPNAFQYVGQNPVRLRDATGATGEPSEDDVQQWIAKNPVRVNELLGAPLKPEEFKAAVLNEVRRSMAPPQMPTDPRCRPISNTVKQPEKDSRVLGPARSGVPVVEIERKIALNFSNRDRLAKDPLAAIMTTGTSLRGSESDEMNAQLSTAEMISGLATAAAAGGGRGAASREALSRVKPGPAVQVGTTGRTPTVPAATTTGERASPQTRGGKVHPGSVNTGAPGVRSKNCGQCSGALLEGRGAGSSDFGTEGLINLQGLRQQYAARGIQIGATQTAATEADLMTALKNLPEGTNVQIGYDYANGKGGHWTTALVGKGGQVRFIEPQYNPVQVVNGPPPGAKNFDYFVVKPVQR